MHPRVWLAKWRLYLVVKNVFSFSESVSEYDWELNLYVVLSLEGVAISNTVILTLKTPAFSFGRVTSKSNVTFSINAFKLSSFGVKTAFQIVFSCFEKTM